jgi:hypothetical protein
MITADGISLNRHEKQSTDNDAFAATGLPHTAFVVLLHYAFTGFQSDSVYPCKCVARVGQVPVLEQEDDRCHPVNNLRCGFDETIVIIIRV